MKLIIFDRKKIGIFIVIIGLMMALVGIERQFDEKLQTTSLLQNNIKSLKEYKILNNKIKYKLPEEWHTEEDQSLEGELLYNNVFFSRSAGIHGFIKVWNGGENLINFIEENRINSETENKINNYEMFYKNYNERKAYKIRYKLIENNKSEYNVYEYYINCNNYIVEFAFFIREHDFKENMPTNFDIIVKSLEIKN